MADDALSTEKLAALILESPSPVVFLDSAAVLDLLRAAHRADTALTIVRSAADLIHSRNPPTPYG